MLVMMTGIVIMIELFLYNHLNPIIDEGIKKNEFLLGMTDVVGEGIVINLNDGNDLIHQEDIMILIDELKNAGAEAISLNGQRITGYSFIYCNGSVILIDGVKISTPFMIEATGDKELLYSALSRNGGYISTLKKQQIEVEIQQKERIFINKTNKTLSQEYEDCINPIHKLYISNQLTGKQAVKGSGIEIVIDTHSTQDISAIILLQIVNDLNYAGAKAISINEQRIVSSTDIIDINEYILIDNICVSSPYVIKAIGDEDILESQMKVENSTISKLGRSSKNINIGKYKHLTVNRSL